MDVTSYLLGKKNGGVTPTGEVDITQNGVHNVSGYATANVQVPEPTGNINITDTNVTNVKDYATAQVIDTNLVQGNIKKDVSILGVTGTLEQGIFPTGTINITKNGTVDVTDYASANVNVPTVPVDVEEKDVNFYDYDGLRVYSYTAQEFANLSAMPENPTHEGLTAQGWNWDLTDAKNYVASYKELDIGQTYDTSDGKTRIYITIPETRKTIKVRLCLNGTATIEWGDGTSETLTGTNTYSVVASNAHTYQNAGDYVIKIYSDTTIYINGSSSVYYQQLIRNGENNEPNTDQAYKNMVNKIEFSSNFYINRAYAFSGMWNLKIVSLPKQTSSSNINGNNAFENCRNLVHLNVPSNYTTLSGMSNLYSLKHISLPNGIIFNNTGAFKYNYKIKRISLPTSNWTGTSALEGTTVDKYIIPATITNIPSYTFKGNNVTKIYDFSHHTAIPTIGSNVFDGNQYAEPKIIVPDTLYEDWIATSGWSTYASYIVKASEA